ncbi:MAG TPA: ATP synthase F1 subunit delta [Bryobacteraceae bacterium]|nr:ATP synthase F1 subunit delta [Bryobacteraceae bacterium]
MTLSAVATRYAHALADVVTAGDSPLRPADAIAQLRSFEAALKASPALTNALTTPAVPIARKRAVVGRIGHVLELGQITRNFLYVLVDHRRITLLSQVIETLELTVEERLGFGRAEVSSAAELSHEQQTALLAKLEQVTGKRLRARYAVDDALIGGVVARIGSTVYDGSVRGRLNGLRHQMRADS